VVVKKGVEQEGGVLALFDSEASAGITERVHEVPEI